MAASHISSTAESQLVFNNTDPKTSLISVNMAGLTKLTATNYITWRLQVQALFEAYELHCYLDETAQVPSAKIIVDNTKQPNPLFAPWKRQDRMLYSAILGTLSLGVQPIVSRATTTREIWKILSKTYGAPSHGHIKQIKQQLKRITKGFLSIDDYMSGINTKADQLALLGAPIDHEDLLNIITDGLGDDYRHVIDMVNGRDIPITLEELHEKLLNRELTLLATTHLDGNFVPVTTNAVQYSAPRRNYNPTFNRGQSYSTNTNSHRGQSWIPNSYNNSLGSYHNNNSRGPFKSYLGKCQFCDSQGHSARRCPQLAG